MKIFYVLFAISLFTAKFLKNQSEHSLSVPIP